MVVPTFVDLQGFFVGKAFFVKEIAILKNGYILSHFIFASLIPHRLLTYSETKHVCWLKINHHGLPYDSGSVPYSEAKRLITSALKRVRKDATSRRVYVKGLEKRKWLADLLDEDVRSSLVIDTLEHDYVDVPALQKLDSKNTLCCKNHEKNCAMQNVFKLYNWWSNNHHTCTINPYL